MYMDSKQRRKFALSIHRALRTMLIGQQSRFFVALAHELMDENGQYKPGVMQRPMYRWTKETLFGNKMVYMTGYLQRARKLPLVRDRKGHIINNERYTYIP